MSETLKALESSGVVAIMRGFDTETSVKVAHALYKGGVTCLEVTFPSPGALDSVRAIAEQLPDVTIGMGTVMTAEEVEQSAEAGAKFIVAPNTDEAVIKKSKELGLVCAPGAMTPTEAVAAHRYGADVVKIFPASVATPAFFREMKGPCPYIKFMATGGVTLENAEALIKGGAHMIGLGGALVDKKLIAEGRYDLLEERARQLVETVKNARQG